MRKPPALGTVWTARATLYNSAGRKIGTCMDTPNSIAKAFMEFPQATSVSALMGYQTRAEFSSRMKPWNVATSHLHRVGTGNRAIGVARRRQSKPRLTR